LTTKGTKDTKEGTKEKMRASRHSWWFGMILNLVSLVSLVVK